MLQIILDALAAAGEAGLTAVQLVAQDPIFTTGEAGYWLREAYRHGYARIIESQPGDGIGIRVALFTQSAQPAQPECPSCEGRNGKGWTKVWVVGKIYSAPCAECGGTGKVTPPEPTRSLVDIHDEGELAAHLADD